MAEVLAAHPYNHLLAFTLCLVAIALFINGATDSPSSVATVIATGVLSPKVALFVAAIMNFGGTFLGGKVAITITSGVVSPALVTLPVLCAAMLAIILWGSIAWVAGLPISKSHALIAGLAGAGFASGGWEAYTQVWNGWWNGWTKVFVGLVLSPVLGFLGARLLAKLIIFFCAEMDPRRGRKLFDWLQVVSASIMAGTHGSNDGPKFAGVTELALILAAVDTLAPDGQPPVHWEVIAICATIIGIGTYVGGRRIIVKIGKKLGDNIASWQGFATETASSSVIFLASSLGMPISTTHVVVSGIAGSSSALRSRDVSWGVALEIIRGWVLTLPVCWVLGFGIGKLFLRLF